MGEQVEGLDYAVVRVAVKRFAEKAVASPSLRGNMKKMAELLNVDSVEKPPVSRNHRGQAPHHTSSSSFILDFPGVFRVRRTRTTTRTIHRTGHTTHRGGFSTESNVETTPIALSSCNF